jgi:membrane protein implicated in regulation of membrane protease activity
MIALLFVVMVLTLIVKFWHLIVAVLVLYALLRWVIEPWYAARERDSRDRLRHARARQEIDDITFAAARAMYEAADTINDGTIDGTAVEVRR